MFRKIRSTLGLAAAVTLSFGALTACSEAKSDAAACETFNAALGEAQALAELEPAQAASKLEGVSSEVKKQAESPELASLVDRFSSDYAGFASGDEAQPETEGDYFGFLINFLRIGELCEAAGVNIEGYTQMKGDLDMDGITIDELEEMVGYTPEDE